MNRRSRGLVLCALCMWRCSAARSQSDSVGSERAKITARAKAADAVTHDASDASAVDRLAAGGLVDPVTERIMLLGATPGNAEPARPVARAAFSGAVRFAVDDELNALGYPRSLRRAERAVIACFVAENARSPLPTREVHFDVTVDSRGVARWELDTSALAARAAFVACVERALRTVRIPTVERDGFNFTLVVRVDPPRPAYTPTRREVLYWDCTYRRVHCEQLRGTPGDGSLRSPR